MSGEIISYPEMCMRENAGSLQHGMNFRSSSSHSVFLMSTRDGSPYDDKIEDGGKVLIYEGHDAPKTDGVLYPKLIDQPRYNKSGSFTRNGKFEKAALDFKNGVREAEPIRVYEKIKAGIWSYNGVFELLDCWEEKSGERTVFKYRLSIIKEIDAVNKTREISVGRLIPSSVKQAVWKRDDGKCVKCGSVSNLHFDHILPYSKGGTSLKKENVQLLCAAHNLEKSAKII